MENKTAMQELREKCNNIVEDNMKSGSQFHKGFRWAFGMVIEAIDGKLMDDERRQIIEAHLAGQRHRLDNDNPDSEEYFNQTYNTNEQHSSK